MHFQGINQSQLSSDQRDLSKDNSVKNSLYLMKVIESVELSEVNRLLQIESISRNTISAGINKALQNYKQNSEMIYIIDSLLNHNGDPNYIINTSNMPKSQKVNVLMYAAKLGDFKLVKVILNYHPNVNLKDINNKNAIFYALESGDNWEIIQSLISAGVNLNEISGNQSPLSIAISKNYKNSIKILIENKADVNFVTEYGDSILHLAIQYSDLEIVKMLLEKGANVNKYNKENVSAIELAIKKSQTDMYQVLVEEFNKNSEKNLNEYKDIIDVEKRRKSKKLEYIENKKLKKADIDLEIPLILNKENLKSTQLNGFFKLNSTPTLHIDLSDKNKENIAIMSYRIDEMSNQLLEYEKKLKFSEEHIKYLLDENNKLKSDNKNLIDNINQKDKTIMVIQDLKIKEEQYIYKVNELQKLYDDKCQQLKDFIDKYNKIEREYYEKFNNFEFRKTNESCKKETLERKFSSSKYDDKYIMRSLHKDILDFQEFTKDQIKKNKIVLDELIKLIQNTVNECIPDYEVKLYGSHATNLCLPWSDLDIVLINKRQSYSSEYRVLQQLYVALLEKPWKRSIKFIDTALIPIIKINTTDDYNSIQMDISLQDSKHYGIKCVELVKSFLSEYEALEPMIFALKNLLKNANLNDPYTGGLSSYGLILMVVSYLQSQLESNKSIKIADGNLGRLFVEFLCYYGIIFDHSKYVIYTYPPSEMNYLDKDSNNFFLNMQSGHELIIVDPLNKQNNVARSTYQFMNIKMAFMIGFVVSREDCECGCHFNRNEEEFLMNNTEHCILKRIFNSVKRFNANVNS